jgi:hypothetical protein
MEKQIQNCSILGGHERDQFTAEITWSDGHHETKGFHDREEAEAWLELKRLKETAKKAKDQDA